MMTDEKIPVQHKGQHSMLTTTVAAGMLSISAVAFRRIVKKHKIIADGKGFNHSGGWFYLWSRATVDKIGGLPEIEEAKRTKRCKDATKAAIEDMKRTREGLQKDREATAA